MLNHSTPPITRLLKISLAALQHIGGYWGKARSSQPWLTRNTWVNVHLILALTVGFIFALLGFTGSISIYHEELDELLNPHLVIESSPAKYQSLDKIIAAVKAEHPKRYGEWTLEMPRTPHSMMTVWFEKPQETYFERYAPLMVSVNPYSAQVVASRFWGQTATTWLMDVHTQLLAGDWGWNIIGGCGLLLVISISTGLYLWWPGFKQMRSVLVIRVNAGWVRLLFDLHRWLGLLSAPALLLLAVTGFNLSFPGILESIAGTTGMAHGGTGEKIVSTAQPNNHPTLLEAAEFIARGPFATAQLRRVTTPDGETGVYRINLRQKTEINQRHPYTTVWVDRWSGQIREVRDPKSFTTSQQLITWIWPLHSGESLGGAGRFAWFLAGQSLFFLYVSGLVRWLHRKGKIKDKAVDFSRLKQARQWLCHHGQRLLVLSVAEAAQAIVKFMQHAKQALPVLTRLLMWLGGLLKQVLALIEEKSRK
jgi:uncharacterized iron-regulated membrane protein